MIAVSAIYIYPVKACGGLSLPEAGVTQRGLRHDRRWMIVDERGMFVAQRTGRGLGVAVSSMCLIRTALDDKALTLTAPAMSPLRLPLDAAGVELPVTVWDDRLTAIDQGQHAEDWVSEFLSRERHGRYRLVRMRDDARRGARIGDAEVAFNEPLKTLATYRKEPDGVVFGRNFNHLGSGTVKVGVNIAMDTPVSLK